MPETAHAKRGPPLGELCVALHGMQMDAALNEQRIMLATSAEHALKNSCFVVGTVVLPVCVR